MSQLRIIGPEPNQKFDKSLDNGKILKLGRSSDCDISVPWDRQISRVHAHLRCDNDKVVVKKLDGARNYLAQNDQHFNSLELESGDEFRIGQTVFQFQVDAPDPDEGEVEEFAFGRDELRQVEIVQKHSVELLATIPELMTKSRDDTEFAVSMVDLLLEAIPRCDAAAVVAFDNESLQTSAGEPVEPSLLRWHSRNENVGRFRPSRRLMVSALSREESVLHIWEQTEEDQNQFTNVGDLDWAYCTPIADESSRGWCLYVTGSFDQESPLVMKEKLKEPMRFTELMAQFIGAVRSVRQLQQTQTRMSSFFPPTVVETLTHEKAEDLLTPRTSEITVLFCDLRGFSKKTEQSSDDLPALLKKISEALSVMVRGIMDNDGIIADFQGDAALAFWGWPKSSDESVLQACRAALSIQRQFTAANPSPDHPLNGFSIGIGIGHGAGIAGQIGPPEQSKVGVFGTVVNQAARLQSMTKQFKVPILIDDSTAEIIRASTDSQTRCRRIARVRPRGMDTVMTISELLLPIGEPDAPSAEHVHSHEEAIDAFIEGRWNDAEQIFASVLADDTANHLHRAVIQRQNGQPPDDWAGVINFKN